uniref:O(6)-methylguanine-induced apoptosis 2 n=1 Tax=Anolis carolinensis TaxID=28377 RepID=H9GP55_ANOCA
MTHFTPCSSLGEDGQRIMGFAVPSPKLPPTENPISHRSAQMGPFKISKTTQCRLRITRPMLSSLQSSRIARQRIPSYPASNAYNLPPTLQSKQDFSLGYSSMFQQPIARKIYKRPTPAPNQYNVSLDFCRQRSHTGVKSVFTSKTQRSLTFLGKERVPSPCHYQIKDSFIRQAPTVLVSCFKSKTRRETKPETLGPGPAAYQWPPESPRTVPERFPGLKYGLNFSAPPLPRPKSPPSPGPGQYEIVDFNGPSKHYISSAVFVSNTGRWSGDNFHQDVPGPGKIALLLLETFTFILSVL